MAATWLLQNIFICRLYRGRLLAICRAFGVASCSLAIFLATWCCLALVGGDTNQRSVTERPLSISEAAVPDIAKTVETQKVANGKPSCSDASRPLTAHAIASPKVDAPATPAKKPENKGTDKSGKKKKRPLHEGMSGTQRRALECVVCSRPRESDQRGKACPTCQNVMRQLNARSIPAVLADESLQSKISQESLAAKPIPHHHADMRNKLASMERMLRDLKRGFSQP